MAKKENPLNERFPILRISVIGRFHCKQPNHIFSCAGAGWQRFCKISTNICASLILFHRMERLLVNCNRCKCVFVPFLFIYSWTNTSTLFFLGGYLTKIKRKNIVCEMFCNSQSFFLFIERLIHILNLEFQMVCAYFHSNLSFKFCVGLFCIKSR